MELLDSKESEQPLSIEQLERFEEEFLGLKAQQDYRVINLWEIEAEDIFGRSLTSLMPFVPILKGGSDQTLIRQAVQILQQDP